MENKKRNNFYAVPLIGGILCIYAIFGNSLLSLSLSLSGSIYFLAGFPFLIIIIFFGPIILDLVLGILMIVSAVKMKNGKTTLFEEKKKLLIFSWLVVSVSLGLSIFSIFGFGTFFFFYEPGLVGGLIIILGNFFYKLVTKRNFIYGPPLVQEGEETEPRAMIDQSPIIVHAICSNCGFKSGEESLKFCPKCGNRLDAKEELSV